MLHRLKVLALAALLALAAPEAALAVATTSVTITNSAWTLLGAGPLQITPNASISYAISDTPPAIPLGGGFKLPAGATASINSPSNIYAVATTGAATSVYIAPLPAPGTVSLTWPGSAVVTTYGVAPTGTVPAVNAFVTNPTTFTWPGTAAVTTYGVTPTGTVPAVNAFVTNPATFTWPGTATLTAYGTAPTGTVPAVNAFVTNSVGTSGGPLGVQAISNSQAVNPATASIWSTNASQWGGAAITNVPTAVGTAGTGNTPTLNAYIVGGVVGGGPVTLASGAVAAGAYSLGSFAAGSMVDGASATIGTTGDAVWSGSGAGTQVAILKKIATGGSGGGPATLAAGSVAAGAYVAGSYVDGAITTMGLKADAAWDGLSTSPTEMAVLKKIATNSATFTWPGTAGVATGGTATGGTMPYVSAYLVGALPAFAAPPTVNLGSIGAAATAANQTNGSQVTTITGTLPAFASPPTVTANAGTNLNTSALALEAGGNLAGVRTNQTNGTQLARVTSDGANTLFGVTTPGRIACPDGTTTCFGGSSSGIPPFTPDLSFATPLNVTTTSATTPLPAGGTAGKVVIVYNAGPNTLYWTVGNSSVTATISNSFLPPQSWAAFTVVAGQTTIAAITKVSGQVAVLNAESGTGMPQGTGGPINAAVVPNGSGTGFYDIIGGVDNSNNAARLGTTAAGTASTQGVMPVQGAGPTSVPLPVVAAPNITAQTCFAGPLVANVAQNLINISTATNGFMLQNIDATSGGGEAIWVSFVGAAAIGAVDSFALPPPTSATTMSNAGSFTTPMWFGTKGPVSVIVATSGHKLSCVLGHT